MVAVLMEVSKRLLIAVLDQKIPANFTESVLIWTGNGETDSENDLQLAVEGFRGPVEDLKTKEVDRWRRRPYRWFTVDLLVAPSSEFDWLECGVELFEVVSKCRVNFDCSVFN